ncbi:hypothetical protein GIB67_008574 [Kingdonia uniflora]|uniref:UspA domain-containing protein n=1 Tax=Kingdonia uniflora TaxID=39325 RepID=A0A7J7N3V6_9MAGN|nr:hypothetical protein GIB67_008574 [Kingdonia uniflora]
MANAEAKDRKILVAVDEGEESMYALSWALTNIISKNSKVILLYAKPSRVIYPTVEGTGYLFSSNIIATMDKYGNDVADCVMEKAKKLCKEFEHVKVEAKVEMGDPRDAICDSVEKIEPNILVMGTHGYGIIKRTFLGSVSNHCAQRVKCPVLIVKRPKPATEK